MRLGFIGTGGITTAIVTGLCTTESAPESIWVSPRNKEKAAHLDKSFTNVHIGASNQHVIDHSNVVFLAVLPQDKEEILNPLTFRKDQVIIHLLAGTRIQDVRPLVRPAENIVRAVPLPCTAIHAGPIAIYPDHKIASDIFNPLGTVVALEEESHLETLANITGLMAPYFAMLDQVVSWGVEEGIARGKSAAYTASMFGALSKIAESFEGGDIKTLVKDCMTPGGLNELAMKIVNEQGGFTHIRTALDAVKEKTS